jgi:hypothetical protein
MEAAKSNRFDNLQSAVVETIGNGYPASQIVSQVFEFQIFVLAPKFFKFEIDDSISLMYNFDELFTV